MKDQIDYIGPYRMKQDSFLYSSITVNGVSYRVPDAVGATDDGRNIARLMPNDASNAELVNLVQDGDLIGYIREPMHITWPCAMTPEIALGILKGRVSHTELGYAGNRGCPMQTSIFNETGPRVPRDRPIYEDYDNAALGIYRASLANYEIPPKKETALKAEVKRHESDWVVPCAEIRDWPQFRWRGLMIDEARKKGISLTPIMGW